MHTQSKVIELVYVLLVVNLSWIRGKELRHVYQHEQHEHKTKYGGKT